MKPAGLDRLTDKQRQCLRHVYAHKSSKEIAPLLGVEPGTVDQYLKAAIKILGAKDRRDAAIILARHEGRALQSSAYQPLDVATAPFPANLGGSIEGERYPQGTPPVEAVHEYQAAFVAAPLKPQGPRIPLPYWGVRPSDLGPWQRLGWIFGLMLIICLVFGVFLAGLEALSRIGRLIAS